VGRSLDFGKAKLEVIGVAGDVHNEGLNVASSTALYVPASLFPRGKLDLFARASGNPLSVAAAVRQTIQNFEPDQAISNIEPLERQGQQTLARPLYSGNANCPLTRKVPVTTGAAVLGCPPPTERVYWPSAMMGSPASVTMPRSRGLSSKWSFCEAPAFR